MSRAFWLNAELGCVRSLLWAGIHSSCWVRDLNFLLVRCQVRAAAKRRVDIAGSGVVRFSEGGEERLAGGSTAV